MDKIDNTDRRDYTYGNSTEGIPILTLDLELLNNKYAHINLYPIISIACQRKRK